MADLKLVPGDGKKFVIEEATDVDVLLRIANRSERLIRLRDYGAPSDILEQEIKMLSDVTAEWTRRYPKKETP